MSSSMSMSTSAMSFNTNNLETLLFSTSWVPITTGQYVGSWFFTFFLAVIWRALVFVQKRLDHYWIRKHSTQYVGNDSLGNIPVAFSHTRSVQDWRLSVNLPRAILAYVVQSIAYLLMILVMTMNVGLFFAVTIGFFFGELFFGRPDFMNLRSG
ncbi:Ctr copper transporter [Talaromyces proteolyticus]|uniref:Copper transport protein n=1 Tax=Talaromyces proteolyticus TaxID=1131652 RepID=A0AAD4L4D2_9EURO|nr:Ctr copper transporter [Talaromyces proteolyticus]KAH8703993.1 Ctr copper transporter [Talaromyces proteolyticus]